MGALRGARGKGPEGRPDVTKPPRRVWLGEEARRGHEAPLRETSLSAKSCEMNAVMSLCHFCETHGPRIVFTTQAYFASSSEGAEERVEGRTAEGGGGGRRQFYGDEEVVESGMRWLEREAPRGGPEWDRCASCSSVPSVSKAAFLTNDHQGRASFLSGQYPFHPDVLRILRNSSLRSLSCEVCPDGEGPNGEGPVFFGDEDHGYTLSYTFHLRDSRARGFQHAFSLLIVSMDKLLLLNFYDVLVESLAQTTQRLQCKASAVFEAEQRAVGRSGGLQLSGAQRAAMLPSGFLRQRHASAASSRPLQELTADPDVFRTLHRTFSWILNRSPPVVEKELNGQPSQDELCRLEEEEEEALWAQHSVPSPVPGGPQSAFDWSRVRRAPFFGAGPSGRLDGQLDLSPYRELKRLARVLGPEAFLSLAGSVLVGEQVVVRSDERWERMRAMDALSVLLPYGCTRLVYHAAVHQPGWVCNLLGLEPEAELAEEWRGLELWLEKDGARVSGQREGGGGEGEPALVGRLRTLLCESSLGEEGLAQLLLTARADWVAKAQQLFDFTRQHPDLPPDKLRRFLQLLGVRPADERLVAFWQAGLSKEYKASVLAEAAALAQKKNSDAASSNTSALSD